MPTKLTHVQFIQQLTVRNDNKTPVYTGDLYAGHHVRHTFVCERGHTWEATPTNVLRGAGCPQCAHKARKTTPQFISELQHLNATREITVTLEPHQEYISAFTPLWFRCDAGHRWKTTPSNIINNKQTCRVCTGKAKKTTTQFVAQLNDRYPEIELVNGQTYTTAHSKLVFRCNKGHEWSTRPIDVLVGYGCPECVRRGYSRKSITWLDSIATTQHLHIRHAENGGEYAIPDTAFYADGFCETTNTVYEFYGDVYHGNPKLFQDTDKCHPYDKRLTAKALYERTMKREQILRDCGYNVVTIWEHDYDNAHTDT